MGDTRDFIARSTGLKLAALRTENELMNEASLKLMPGLSADAFIYESKQPLLTLGA